MRWRTYSRVIPLQFSGKTIYSARLGDLIGLLGAGAQNVQAGQITVGVVV